MANRLPYFRWYPADAETDEWFKSLTDSEIGYYWRMMNHAWINGSIPAEQSRRCRLFKVHYKTDQSAFNKLSIKFQQDPNDSSRLVHTGLQQQVNEIAMKSAKAAESVNHRYERSYDESTPRKQNVDRHVRVRADSGSVSDIEVNTEKTEYIPLARVKEKAFVAQFVSGFDEWWNLWSSKRGTAYHDRAGRAWISVVQPTDPVMECTASYLASGKCDDGSGWNPDNFLFEMAKDRFTARWPARATQGKPSLSERTMELVKRRIANGESPL